MLILCFSKGITALSVLNQETWCILTSSFFDLKASRVSSGDTYASVPQRRVSDFRLSLSYLSELRRAVNFLSRAGHLWKRTGCRIRNPQNSLHAAGMLILYELGILSWNSVSRPPLFLPPYCSTSLSKRLTLRKFQSIVLEPEILWKRWFARAFCKQKVICLSILQALFLLLCHFTWISICKTHDLTDHQLIVGHFTLCPPWPFSSTRFFCEASWLLSPPSVFSLW